ncbi:hypothetical protein GF324_10590 [bacterium]|nr:hypothetical protein [bacterium]
MRDNRVKKRKTHLRPIRLNSALLGILLLLTTAGSVVAQEGQIVDEVVAVVGNEIILESEVMQYVQDVVMRNPERFQSEQDVMDLRKDVLDELIDQKILLSAAEDDTNVVVEEREVDQVLDDRINQVMEAVGGESQLEDYYGKPLRQIRRDFREQVRDNLMIERYRNMRLMHVQATRPEVEQFYEENRNELPKLPERVHLAHILFNVEPTEDAQQRARELADSLYNELLMGANFEELAMKHSQDRASGAKGGLLGTTKRGDFVPEFEEIAYNLEEGEISSPVRTRFGLHIIRLNWRRGEKINTSHILIDLKPSDADERRTAEQATEVYRELQAGADFAETARRLSDDEETARNGGDLGWFDISQMPKEFRIVARDLDAGEISEPFKTRFGVHILKVIERQTERTMSLEQDWERISRLAADQKRQEAYKDLVDRMSKDVYVQRME